MHGISITPIHLNVSAPRVFSKRKKYTLRWTQSTNCTHRIEGICLAALTQSEITVISCTHCRVIKREGKLTFSKTENSFLHKCQLKYDISYGLWLCNLWNKNTLRIQTDMEKTSNFPAKATDCTIKSISRNRGKSHDLIRRER